MRRFMAIPILFILGILMIGISDGEMTLQTSATAAPSVYTTGTIYIASTPAGASASLDGGNAQLFTPGTFKGVEPGSHHVLITLQGFQPNTTTVKVTKGTTQNIFVTLLPVTNPGGISVTSTPRGAGLYVDDLSMGKTNQVVGNLAPGPHRVVISEAGYVAWSDTVTVKSGEISPVTATLVAEINPDHGDLQVSSNPSGAAVYVDGDYQGVTPSDDLLDIHDLSPGTHALTMKMPGYLDYSTSVSIQAGKKVQVVASLQPGTQTAASVEITSSPAGADVFVNDVYMGITPLIFHDIKAGTYTVDIRMEGYVPFSSSGQVMAGQSVHVIAVLSPVPVPSATTRAPQGIFAGITALMVAGVALILTARR